jgi:hypothetical protein
MSTNISRAHRGAFKALTSGQYGNFALFSCFVDGEPAVAIVTVNEDGPGYVVTPLYVSVTERMTLTDHDGIAPSGGAP